MSTRTERAGLSLVTAVRPPLVFVAVIAALVALSTSASSDVTSGGPALNIEPSCGKPGDPLRIFGAGWEEPDPPCDYIFYFDGQELVRQPDGLFGDPDQNVTVPASAAAGVPHIVKVELRITEGQALRQCRQTSFKVVLEVKDPWKFITNVEPGTFKAFFDPTDVCTVTSCTAISFIQVVKLEGIPADGDFRRVTAKNLNLPQAPTFDVDTTPNGWAVDVLSHQSKPYYLRDTSVDGIQNGEVKVASMDDVPNINDGHYPGVCEDGTTLCRPRPPAGQNDCTGIGTGACNNTTAPGRITGLSFQFELAAFCREGQSKGKYFGTTKWEWLRIKEQPAQTKATVTSAVLGDPSPELKEAVQKFTLRTGISLPTPEPPKTGGEACQ